jgi:hypothetical protein
MSEDLFNPYVPPASNLAAPRLDGGLSIRAAMLKHEVSIHSVALAFFGLGVLLVCAGLVVLLRHVMSATVAYGIIALGALNLFFDYGLRRHWKPVQIAAVVVSALTVFVFPFYLLIAIYVIPTLVNQQARQIFSTEYRAVIAASPHLSITTPRAPRVIILTLGIAFTVTAVMITLGR